MPANQLSILERATRTLSSIRTGILLLILLSLASLAGTLVLQRPLVEPEKITAAYSPATLAWLDRLGLTDVFHSWWFVFLLSLVSLNIVIASLERFPAAWRHFSRPARRPEPHILAGLPLREEIEIPDAARGLAAAARAFRRQRFTPRRLGHEGDASLFAERHRFARLAAYVVHASLLLIFAGGIVDAVWGFRGFVALGPGHAADQIELRDGTPQKLGFSLRCDAAGQENYPDGTPSRWWSKLAVMENGREVLRKEIAVNDPLTHRGLRFFQSSYGSTGQVSAVRLLAASKSDPARTREISLRLGETGPLDDSGSSVTLAAFIPDFVLRGRTVESRSDQPNNPAVQLKVRSPGAEDATVWIFPRFPNFPHGDQSPFSFQFRDLEMGYFTGLQVAYQPGQWAVWFGCMLMVMGLSMAFYFVHIRFWAVPLTNARGRLVLCVAASASKNRDEFEARFRKVVANIRSELAELAQVSSAPAISADGHRATTPAEAT